MMVVGVFIVSIGRRQALDRSRRARTHKFAATVGIVDRREIRDKVRRNRDGGDHHGGRNRSIVRRMAGLVERWVSWKVGSGQDPALVVVDSSELTVSRSHGSRARHSWRELNFDLQIGSLWWSEDVARTLLMAVLLLVLLMCLVVGLYLSLNSSLDFCRDLERRHGVSSFYIHKANYCVSLLMFISKPFISDRHSYSETYHRDRIGCT